MYKTIVLPFYIKSAKIAQAIEHKANEMEKDGYTLISATTMPAPRTILIFKK